MILLTILAVIIVAIALVVVVPLLTGATLIAVIFGDLFICIGAIWFIVWIWKKIRRK